jgi:predicted deacetylase
MVSPAPQRAFVVSIHDVSPLTWEDTERILQSLAERGVHTTSLLVIPFHHEKEHFTKNPQFRDWLAAKAAAGHEVVIHGYTHRRARKTNESLVTRGMTRVYTADEGEFFDISEEKALEKVSRAQREFREMGLNPEGFIAPAWLLSESGERALVRAGIRYTTRLRNVTDFKHHKTCVSQSLVYSVRSAWRRWTSLRWNTWLYRSMKSAPLLRLGVHPPDFAHEAIKDHLLDIVSSAIETRTACTYLDWVNQS